MTYKIRRMSKNDAKTVWGWAKVEGWNPGSEDWMIFPAIDPDGCFVGIIDNNIISSITAIKFNNKFGFIGMYIVKHGYRGKGYGFSIWKHAMDYLLNDACVESVGLDGVLTEEKTYQKSGFKSAYKTTRYKYTVNKSYATKCEGIKDSQFHEIFEYDTKVTKIDRRYLLTGLIKCNGTAASAAYDNGHLSGFIVARPAIEGFKIGPCFADSAYIARLLLESIFSKLKNQIVFIDVPETNNFAEDLVKSYGMEAVFSCIRMYIGEKYNQDVRYVFGNTSFEAG